VTSNIRTYTVDSLILMLFFLSGTCGLIYEVTWAKMLTWSFGSTVFATSTVLVAFMGGLGLGSLVFGRLVDSYSDRSLEVYAILQAGIGLFAFAVPFLLGGLDRIYDHVYQSFRSSFYLFSLIRFTLSLTILIIPTTLMGGTLPVISRAFVRSIGRAGSKVGLLYFVNTLGAVAGAIAAGFFLIERVGSKETTFIAGLLNFFIAGTVMLMSRQLHVHRKVQAFAYDQKGQEMSKHVLASTTGLSMVYLALLIYTLSGFCALGYEVLWTRVLVFFLGSSTYAFTIILATFLLGLALGSLFAARFVQKKNLFLMLGAIEISIGLFGMLSLLILVRLDSFSTSLYSFFSRLEWWKLTMIRFIQSFLILLVPTFLMGMAFPVVIKICSNSIARLGRSLGNLCALNTFGAAVGSFAAGFILIPVFGLQKSITVRGTPGKISLLQRRHYRNHNRT
jgi:spermidine synthase